MISELRVDPATESYLATINVPARVTEEEMGPEEAREFNRKELVAEFGPQPVVRSFSDYDADGVPVRIFEPLAGREGRSPFVLYLHGGGWTVGDLDSHIGVSKSICAMTGTAVVAVDYRLAPDSRYPAAVDDSATALAWLMKEGDRLGLDTARYAVLGDSSGGNLAAVLVQRASGQELAHPPSCQVLVYPPVDSTTSSASYASMSTGFGLESAEMRWYWQNYLGEDHEPGDAGHSPLRSKGLSGLPPALVITAELDPLRDEAEEYGRAMVAAGVPVLMRRFLGTIHGFFRMPGTIPLGADALQDAASFISEHLGVSGQSVGWSHLTFEAAR